jgi:hypothetical protein
MAVGPALGHLVGGGLDFTQALARAIGARVVLADLEARRAISEHGGPVAMIGWGQPDLLRLEPSREPQRRATPRGTISPLRRHL